jgi:hypothetical protein
MAKPATSPNTLQWSLYSMLNSNASTTDEIAIGRAATVPMNPELIDALREACERAPEEVDEGRL